MKRVVGYTQGVFDLFHIGHLNIFKRAKEKCDYLIVGVNSDRLVKEYKNKIPEICERDRKTIVENIKCVDEAFVVDTLNKVEVLADHHFDIVFIGDDHKGTDRWNETEKRLNNLGIEVVYLPRTRGISSTSIKEDLKNSK